MSRDLSSFITGVIIIAILFVLVNPNSQGPQLVQSVGGALAGLIGAATGNPPAAPAAAPAKKGK